MKPGTLVKMRDTPDNEALTSQYGFIFIFVGYDKNQSRGGGYYKSIATGETLWIFHYRFQQEE